MACRWPPGGMQSYDNFGPTNRPYYQPRVPGPFSPGTCWAPFPSNQWQIHPPPQPNSYRFQRSNNNNNSPRKTKRKEPIYVDFCDVCDRGFKNLAKKAEHFKQHIKCDEPGCSFEAHFKIVAIHKQNLHGPNALKIKLDTPEDIQKWRLERKRKYPTVDNVKLKARKAVEKRELGNVLDNKYFGKVRQKRNTTDQINPGKTTSRPLVKSQSPVQKPLNLLFCDPADALEGSVSSEEEEQGSSEVISDLGNSVGLGSLMQSYASDSEEDATEEVMPNKDVESPVKAEIRHDTESVDSQDQELSGNKVKPKSGDWRRKAVNRNSLNSKRHSLLEMLLAPEIRKERNHILQCVRFIVKNNFFESSNVK